MNSVMYRSSVWAVLGSSISFVYCAQAQPTAAPAPAEVPPAASPAAPPVVPPPEGVAAESSATVAAPESPSAPSESAAVEAPSASEEGSAALAASSSSDTAASEVSAESSAQAPDSGSPRGRQFRHDRESEFENGHQFDEPKSWLEWHGTMNVDTAFVGYNFLSGMPGEELYDLRGRFVLGPTLWHQFGENWFVRARAEFVAWLREVNQSYQINVDDAYVQAGKIGLWDVKVGRFFSWRVYHRGPGFDLFTTEDLGACRISKCATQDPADFGPRMYDVSNIYFRETPGRAALHFYPTSWSGVEALVQYGSQSSGPSDPVLNSLGGRLAGVLSFPILRVSAAAEARQNNPTSDPTQPAEGGGTIPCPTCGSSKDFGFGGGAELTLRDVGLELGANAGYSERTEYETQASRVDLAASGKILSLGGYGQFDVGKYALGTSLVLGAGYNYTQSRRENDNYDVHGQLAAYILWPLGFFKGAAVKFVYTNAQLAAESGAGTAVVRQDAASNAFRLRFSLTY